MWPIDLNLSEPSFVQRMPKAVFKIQTIVFMTLIFILSVYTASKVYYFGTPILDLKFQLGFIVLFIIGLVSVRKDTKDPWFNFALDRKGLHAVINGTKNKRIESKILFISWDNIKKFGLDNEERALSFWVKLTEEEAKIYEDFLAQNRSNMTCAHESLNWKTDEDGYYETLFGKNNWNLESLIKEVKKIQKQV